MKYLDLSHCDNACIFVKTEHENNSLVDKDIQDWINKGTVWPVKYVYTGILLYGEDVVAFKLRFGGTVVDNS